MYVTAVKLNYTFFCITYYVCTHMFMANYVVIAHLGIIGHL